MFDSDLLFPSCPTCVTFPSPRRWVGRLSDFPAVHMCVLDMLSLNEHGVSHAWTPSLEDGTVCVTISHSS